jgi:hypothetical protein
VSEDKAKRKANWVFHPIGRVALACRPPIHAGGRGLGADRWRGCPSVFVCDAQERWALSRNVVRDLQKTLAAIVGALSAGGVEFTGGGVRLAGG